MKHKEAKLTLGAYMIMGGIMCNIIVALIIFLINGWEIIWGSPPSITMTLKEEVGVAIILFSYGIFMGFVAFLCTIGGGSTSRSIFLQWDERFLPPSQEGEAE